MGQMTLASIGDCAKTDCATVTIQWRDDNFRFNKVIVHNGLRQSVVLEILDELGDVLYQERFATGDYSPDLPMSAERKIVLIDEGTDDFEVEFVGIKGLSFGIG